jgi:vacuolar-type H+-ATPase subunit I/STV1
VTDEQTWKRRFYLFMGARAFGLLTFLAGLAIMFTDVLREGGWPALGTIIVILGLIDAIAAPMLLKKQWKKEDRDSG